MQRASTIAALIHLLFIVLGYPVFVAFFFLVKRQQAALANPRTKQVYGSLFSELHYSDRRALAYHVLLLLRRVLLILQATFISREQQFLNIIILLVTSSLLLLFTLRVKPFEDLLVNRLELFNESVVLTLALYHCILYSDVSQLSADPEQYQDDAGWSFVFIVIAVQIPVNLAVIFWDNGKGLWLRRHWLKYKLYKAIGRKQSVGGMLKASLSMRMNSMRVHGLGGGANLVTSSRNETERDLMALGSSHRTEEDQSVLAAHRKLDFP